MAYKCPRCDGPKGRKETMFCRPCRKEVATIEKTRTCERCNQVKRIYAHNKCRICYNTWYNQEHPEKHAAFEKSRRERNPEKVREQDLARNQTEKRKEWKSNYQPLYYAANAEHIRQITREYFKLHPEVRAHNKRRRRARVAGLEATLTLQEWENILKEYNYSCAYCGIQNVTLQREHKIPASRGGGFTAENIVPACATCNLRKQRKTDVEFLEYLKKYPRVSDKK